MIRRVAAPRRQSASSAVAVLLACVAAALSLGGSPALAAEEPCSPQPEHEKKRVETEERRKESNLNSATGEAYSLGLPDCRAYEVISPSYKQGHDAKPSFADGGLPVAPDGNTAGFWSEGVFSGAENFLNQGFFSQYLSQRGEEEWVTSSTFLPRRLVDFPYGLGINGDSTLDLRSRRLSCGQNPAGKEPSEGPGVFGLACVLREPEPEPNGSLMSTGTFRGL